MVFIAGPFAILWLLCLETCILPPEEAKNTEDLNTMKLEKLELLLAVCICQLKELTSQSAL